jgi:cyclase
MKYNRIIARLDIKGPNLVKGIHLEGLRVLGNPEYFSEIYYNEGIDEIIYHDCVASLYNRNSLLDVINRTSKNLFIPLTVGGGIRSIEDIHQSLRAGADKVSINTAAIKRPKLITEAAEKFGSSTIVVAIECIKQSNSKYLAFTDNGREYTGVDVIEWAQEVEKLGAGEILLTSIDKEGLGDGMDLDLIERVSKKITIPLISHGGVGNAEDIQNALNMGSDAIAISSILHYEICKRQKFIFKKEKEGNTTFLSLNSNFGKFEKISISKLKKNLIKKKLNIRF